MWTSAIHFQLVCWSPFLTYILKFNFDLYNYPLVCLCVCNAYVLQELLHGLVDLLKGFLERDRWLRCCKAWILPWFCSFWLRSEHAKTGKALSSYWPVTAMGPLPPWVILERALMSSPSGERNPSRSDSHAIGVIGRVPEAEPPATVWEAGGWNTEVLPLNGPRMEFRIIRSQV